MTWLEVSIDVNGELAEAIAEVFSRYESNGVSLEWIPSEDQPSTEIKVSVYLPVEENIEEQKLQVEQDLWHLAQIHPLPEPNFQLLEDGDWKQAWREHYHVMPVGERLMIIPAWLSIPSSDRHAIILEPGMAFGTGMHPSTRLCLQALEKYLHPGERVLDIGTGSGILSIAAVKLGASHVIAMDKDEKAIAVAQENLIRNEVADRVDLCVGTLQDMGASDVPATTEIIVANILAPVLISLLEVGLSEKLSSDGWLILSGVLYDQVDSLLIAGERDGLQLVEIYAEDEWRALVMKKSPRSSV